MTGDEFPKGREQSVEAWVRLGASHLLGVRREKGQPKPEWSEAREENKEDGCSKAFS